MSYGVGGVAKGGHDCRYRMHEIGVYPPKEQIASGAPVKVAVEDFSEPRVRSPRRLTGGTI